MAKKAPWSLIVLYRAEGEVTFNFTTEAEAKRHMFMLDESLGNRITKMEVVKNG